ncbi:CU044_5270 family protein [Streptomyces mesophilus]|uniref:CU044_5270 family protein n=1 Tax=Streptomyces mesophilus TaxID=1775132 RepID=UPI003333D713
MKEEQLPGSPSPHDRELPPGRHRSLREHLVNEIRMRSSEKPPEVRALWRRPSVGYPVLAALLSGTLVVTLSLIGGGSAPDPADSPRRLLERIARAAERAEVEDVRDDQFIYQKSTSGYPLRQADGAGGLCAQSGSGRPVGDREEWKSVDGTRWGLRREYGDELRLKPDGAEGSRIPQNYRDLERLPTDPDAMYDWLHGTGEWQKNLDDFAVAGNLLADNLMPPEVGAALFRAVAEIPGLRVVQDVVDEVGRRGFAITRADESDSVRTEWIFDGTSLAYLGQRTIVEKETGPCPLKPGSVAGSRALLERAVTDEAGQRP